MDRWYEALLDAIDAIWLYEEWDSYLKALAGKSEPLAAHLLEIGNYSAEQLIQVPKEMNVKVLECYIVSFLWMDRAKSFLILWRDICYEQNKAYFFYKDGEISASDLDQLKADSKNVVSKALEDLHTFFKEKKDTALIGDGQGTRQIKSWALQANPWPTYQQQIAELQTQCEKLLEEFGRIYEAHSIFEKIHTLVEESLQLCEKDVRQLSTAFEDLSTFIADTIGDRNSQSPGKVVSYLEAREVHTESIPYGPQFNETLEQLIKQLLERQRVPIGVSYGFIQFRDIFFQKASQQWLESEILPLLYEIWEFTEDLKLEEKKTHINIRNRALLIKNELKEVKDFDLRSVSFSPSLEQFSKRLSEYKDSYNQLKNQVNDRMHLDFRVMRVFFPNREFLPVPIQYTLNTFRIGQDKFLGNVQDWFRKQVDQVWKLKRKVKEEDMLSNSEKMVRYLKNRETHPHNNHYSSIFLTKGYVGESFWVGRTEELNHIRNLVENWEKGFRGALMMTGNRLSGRSFLGDLVANRFFPDRTLKIRPEMELEVAGRKLSVTYDLEQVLQFIKKYSLQNKPLIWIDDLETWCSPNIPLSKNLKALLELIDDHSHRMFFLVSMTNWAKARMDPFHSIDQAFQATINLDRMASQEIGEAILIRHGATHETLLDLNGNEVTPQRFRKMVKRVIGTAEGNIGDALNLWAASIEKIEEDKDEVHFRFRSVYGLPEFKGPDSLILLSSILLEKQTNEYRLSKLYGPIFQQKYSHVLQRLLNVGLVARRTDGMLQINELAVNDVAQYLFRKNYIKFDS